MYGEDVLTVRQCQKCFSKFRYGNFDVEGLHLNRFFASKDQKFHDHRIMLLPEMAKGVEPEWPIYNLIKYLFITQKSSFIFPPPPQKNEITF